MTDRDWNIEYECDDNCPTGDYVCGVNCHNMFDIKAVEKPPKDRRSALLNGYVPELLDNDLVDKIIASVLPLAITGSYPASCISFARRIEAEVHEKVKQQLGT